MTLCCTLILSARRGTPPPFLFLFHCQLSINIPQSKALLPTQYSAIPEKPTHSLMAEATSSSLCSSTTPLSSVLVKSSSEIDSGDASKQRANTISDYEFFAPAASSFQPRPYAPNSNLSESRIKPFQFTRSQGRSHDALAVPAGMDPHPSDPNVIFIHPPFTTFPNSDRYLDGLCFQVMADNPEWFLDPKDFIHENNANPHAIPYPPILEPPRGWCPAKKKVLKERGAEGWIKGEEPRLRCTFCRRHYAGVNAKSMWRRHVFEKHKIAMANRRDGADRPRGRSSNSRYLKYSIDPRINDFTRGE